MGGVSVGLASSIRQTAALAGAIHTLLARLCADARLTVRCPARAGTMSKKVKWGGAQAFQQRADDAQK
eukprot:817987-Prymnesium_polylepis.1